MNPESVLQQIVEELRTANNLQAAANTLQAAANASLATEVTQLTAAVVQLTAIAAALKPAPPSDPVVGIEVVPGAPTTH